MLTRDLLQLLAETDRVLDKITIGVWNDDLFELIERWHAYGHAILRQHRDNDERLWRMMTEPETERP